MCITWRCQGVRVELHGLPLAAMAGAWRVLRAAAVVGASSGPILKAWLAVSSTRRSSSH